MCAPAGARERDNRRIFKCVRLCMLREGRHRNRLILSCLRESHSVPGHMVPWLSSCTITTAAAPRRHRLSGDDERSGPRGEVMAGAAACEVMELLCCVIISCNYSHCGCPVITLWNLDAGCITWGSKGSIFLTGAGVPRKKRVPQIPGTRHKLTFGPGKPSPVSPLSPETPCGP